MRVLITGAGGQVGRELVEACADDDVLAAGHSDLDVTDRGAVLGIVTTHRPDAIIHAGAWTAVDACEHDIDRAFAVNALGTRNIGDAARRVGAHLTYLSTDYVFDGTKRSPYTEWDRPAPLSVYGRSKLAGEQEAGTDSTAIVRTSWVIGRFGTGGFVRGVIAAARSGGPVRVPSDQRGCPTNARDLAVVIRRLVVERHCGIFHVTNQGDASRVELASAALDWAGIDTGLVEAVLTSELRPVPDAARPEYSVLDNAALRLSGLPLLPDWRESLAPLVRALGS
jgi:dTDP-4-dehydrorhamnose reductase